ncbi:transcriptional regulator [Rhizobium sp. Root1220]|nr:transcriptional regulator [Rhizobium sp. Root1220]
MDDVIAVTGGSKRTLYRYFPSKEDLFFAVIKMVSDRTIVGLTVMPVKGLRETLTTFGRTYLRTIVSPDGLALFRAVVSESPHFPGLGQRFVVDATKRVSDILANFLAQQTEARLSEDPQVAADQFLALLRGSVHLEALLTGITPTAEVVESDVRRSVEALVAGAFTKA